MRGGGGAGVAVSPCGRLGIVGLCSDDSAGGASLPRAGGLRCCCWELLPSTFEPGDDDGDGAGAGFDAVAGGGLGGVAGAGGGDETAGGGGGGALAVSFGAGGVGAAGSGGEGGVDEIVAELVGAFDELGVLR